MCVCEFAQGSKAAKLGATLAQSAALHSLKGVGIG